MRMTPQLDKLQGDQPWLRTVAMLAVAAVAAGAFALAPAAAQKKKVAAFTKAKAVKLFRDMFDTRVVTGTAFQQTGSTTAVDLPGATTSVTVPAGQSSRIIAIFTAESACFGTESNCIATILIGGAEGDPAVGSDFAWDTNREGDATTTFSGEAHAMTRSRGPLGTGTYDVRVQYRAAGAGTTAQLDDWNLTVMRVPA
jgi:hypothetical protein